MVQRVLAAHHVFQRGAVLGAVDALRYAPTPRSAGPSGIDRACAQLVNVALI